MAAPREYARDDSEDVESSRLLGDEHNDASEGQGASDWREYPQQWWRQAREYANDWQKRRTDRGKQRQQDVQRSALSTSQEQSHLARLRQKHPYILTALWVLLGLIAALVVLIIIMSVHLFSVTLRAPNEVTQQRILAKSVNFDGPDNVQVVRFDDDGLTVKIDGRIGVDADSALDEWLGQRNQASWWKRKDRDILEWAMSKVKGLQIDVDGLAVRSPDWNVRRDIQHIDLLPDKKKEISNTIDAQNRKPAPAPADLITLSIEPLLLPVPAVGQAKPNKALTSLPPATTPINLTVLVKPMGPALLSYAEYTLENKTAFLDIKVQNARLRGMNAKDWLRGAVSSSSWWGVPGRVNVHVSDTWKRLAQKLPKIDNGNNTNTDEFLNLTRYDFQEIGGPDDEYPERALGLDIYAEAMNPLGKLLRGHIGYSLPFGAYLPVQDANKTASKPGEQEMVLLAAVATEPFDIHGEKKVPLRLHGRVIPPPPSILKRSQSPHMAGKDKPAPDSNPAADTLSDFLSKFLRGEPNTLYVRGGSPFATPKVTKGSLPMPGGGSDDLPQWLDRLLRTATVPISFPGSKVTDLIQNVSISDLKITPHPFENDKLVCSGIIMGVMNMPGQLATVDVQITDLWPDVLIFNGKPPSMKKPGHHEANLKEKRSTKKNKKGGDDDDDDDDDDTPVPDPLPDPLPEHAFGRVVPRKWAPAETYLDPDDPTGQRKLLRSELKDVPFTVLPGRGAEFRSFSWKVITGEGARAGIDGKAKAKIWNSGLGKLTLSNLPVQGVFTVGKRGSNGGDGDDDGDDG